MNELKETPSSRTGCCGVVMFQEKTWMIGW